MFNQDVSIKLKHYVDTAVARSEKNIVNFSAEAKSSKELSDGVTKVYPITVTKTIVFETIDDNDFKTVTINPSEGIISLSNGSISGISDSAGDDSTIALSQCALINTQEQIDELQDFINKHFTEIDNELYMKKINLYTTEPFKSNSIICSHDGELYSDKGRILNETDLTEVYTEFQNHYNDIYKHLNPLETKIDDYDTRLNQTESTLQIVEDKTQMMTSTANELTINSSGGNPLKIYGTTNRTRLVLGSNDTNCLYLGYNKPLNLAYLKTNGGGEFKVSATDIECSNLNLNVSGTISSPTITNLENKVNENNERLTNIEDKFELKGNKYAHYIVTDIVDRHVDITEIASKQEYRITLTEIVSTTKPIIAYVDDYGNKIEWYEFDMEDNNGVYSFTYFMMYETETGLICSDPDKWKLVLIINDAEEVYLGKVVMTKHEVNYGTIKSNHDQHLNLRNMLELLYPIGSIYTSMNDTNPELLFGFGSWTQIVDRFLYCSNTSMQTGGSKKITVEQLPSHSHSITELDIRGNENGSNQYTIAKYGGKDTTINTGSTGGGKDYLPPYITCYAWYRVA